jgi:hypothetical protein
MQLRPVYSGLGSSTPAGCPSVALHRQYIADIEVGAREALATVHPTPDYMKYAENVSAAVKGYLDAVTAPRSRPHAVSVRPQYPGRRGTGVL